MSLPAQLEAACRGHLRAFPPSVIDATADPIHPTLYFLEGTLALAPERAPGARQVLQRLLVLVDADGSLPESLDTPEVRRSDIIAQALRTGLLLESPSASAATQLDALAAALIARVRDDGSICFQPGGGREQINVWCAMFAQQALSWYALRTQRRLDANAGILSDSFTTRRCGFMRFGWAVNLKQRIRFTPLHLAMVFADFLARWCPQAWPRA